MAQDKSSPGGLHRAERREAGDDDASFEEAYDRLWADVCAIGQSLADDGGFELPDEWPNLVRDWLLEHKSEVLERGIDQDDVAEAFEAWEIGK